MRVLGELFAKNRAWAAEMLRDDPAFFERLSRQQAPRYLWIGCSDSRVPANQIVGLLPGEMFVHRNVANVVVHTDLNCLSVLQFAVDVLRVGHVIVCGHYGCGGVGAALRDEKLGLIDNWLRHVQDVRGTHRARLEALESDEQRHARLCELNVIEQVAHVCETTVVRDAWRRGQALAVHGWIYGLRDGLLRDLGMCVTAEAELAACYAAACGAVSGGHRLLQAADVRIERVDPSVRDARWCVAQYFGELAERFEEGFDPGQSIPADDDELRPPRGAFLVARAGGDPLGCGALKVIEPGVGSLKRMWVGRSARGLGVGRRMLQALESQARDLGLTTLRLETNRALTEAIRLYRSSGYVEVAPFNTDPYANHWFEKRLPRRRGPGGRPRRGAHRRAP